MSAGGPLIALLIGQPIDCKVTGAEIFCETLNEVSCLLRRTSLIPACLGMDGRFIITFIYLQFFVLQSLKLGKPVCWKPCWIYMTGKMIPFPCCWILQGKLELWKSLLMQNILTTTTRVREATAAVNTQGAQTEMGSGRALKVFCMRPYAPQSSSVWLKMCAFVLGLCPVRAIFCHFWYTVI